MAKPNYITFKPVTHTKTAKWSGWNDREKAIVDLAEETQLDNNAAGLSSATFNAGITAQTGLTVTAGTGLSASAGGLTVTAGDTNFRGTIFTKYQPAEATSADSTAAVTPANVLTGIVKCTPSSDHTKAMDDASSFISTLGLTTDNDSFDFSFISLATDGASHVTLSGSNGVSTIGNMVISAQDLAEDAFSSGVGMFRIRRTGASAVTIYRLM